MTLIQIIQSGKGHAIITGKYKFKDNGTYYLEIGKPSKNKGTVSLYENIDYSGRTPFKVGENHEELKGKTFIVENKKIAKALGPTPSLEDFRKAYKEY